MSRWQELFEKQREEERAGTADPETHAEERVDLREQLESEDSRDDDGDGFDDEDYAEVLRLRGAVPPPDHRSRAQSSTRRRSAREVRSISPALRNIARDSSRVWRRRVDAETR